MKDLLEKRIIECLNTCYAIEATSLIPLSIGADMNASVYKAQGPNQKSYFVKLKCGRNHDQGMAILEFLHQEGIPHIIPPVKTSQGSSSQHIDEYTLIVYPYIEHQNGFHQTLKEEQWMVLGRVLRRVHELNIPTAIQHQIGKENYSPKWRDFVRTLWDHINVKQKKNHLADKLIQFMEEHKKEIDRLLDTAELLGKNMPKESAKFVLCHADIHGGNVMLGKDDCIYIVDWDQPIMAPKERDLMFIGGGVANVWNNPHEEDYFYKGYGKTEINISILAYYRHERIIEDIAEYAQKIIFSEEEEDRSEMYQHFIAMFEPRGVVDIAFTTAEKLRFGQI